MKRGRCVERGICAGATAALLLALASGCGSGGTSTSETTTVTIGGRTSTVVVGGHTTTSKTGGLQTDTTPKYATPEASAPVQSGVVPIEYRNIAINPDALKVKVGSTIRWTNYDPVPHNVTSESGVATFKSKNFGEGGTFEYKVTRPGVIHYENTLQPVSMNGTIEVVE
jgi:plastocyanin